MNGRFSRLELGGVGQTSGSHEALREQPLESGTPIRTPEHDMRLATESYRRGQFESALQLYTRALHGNRALIPAWVGQVQMLVELAEYPEARLWADKALEIFKNNGDLLAAKSRACLRVGDARAATACNDASLTAPGSSPQRWQARGEVMLKANADRARDCFDRSLAEPQADWFDRVVISRIYIFHRRPAPALEFARAGVDLQPSDPYAWLILGRAQESLGWSDKAEASYSRSLELPGDHRDARRALEQLQSRSSASRLGRWLKGIVRR
jgi:tetratricopeptide (TPR) repeat protein